MGAPQKNHDWREERRMRAWNLKQAGWKQTDIATALGVTEGAVSQWLKRGREQGVAALKSQPSAGPQPRLTREQHEHLRLMLAQGALAHGYHEAVWTSRRVADLIQQTFGVRYHRAHCSRLLRTLNQSVQNRSCRPGNATKQRLRAGRTNAGQRSKKGGAGGTPHHLRR